MRIRNVRKWPIALFLAFAIITAVTVVTITATGTLSLGPPPPPTPGFPPTPEPYAIKWENPIVTRDEAIDHALAMDAESATRKQPLTRDMVDANPGMVIVEAYETRQEAFETYGFGVVTDPVAASEPVWVVMIMDEAPVRMLGVGMVEADGVTYVFSQANGQLKGFAAGIPPKRSATSP